MRLEAHSGLGDRIDDPRFVDERDHGATPPGVYQLTLRESLFHGVQALRLNPIGGGFTFNRVGLLAHPYMLGPNGDSNGCVSFKTYDVFLRAFQSGEVKRLAVVAQWTGGPRQLGAVRKPPSGAQSVIGFGLRRTSETFPGPRCVAVNAAIPIAARSNIAKARRKLETVAIAPKSGGPTRSDA